MAEDRYAEYRLRVGDAVVGLSAQGPDYVASMASYFQQPSDADPPDVTLKIHVDDRGERPPVPASLYTVKERKNGGFTVGDDLVRCRFDPASGRGELAVKAALMDGRNLRVFEQLLMQAYHSAARRRRLPGRLVHAAGVIREGRGFLFVGHSGAGKSTIARLSADHHVLNDEIIMITPDTADGLLVRGTPFNGFFAGKRPGAAPLAALFLLAHGPAHRVRPVSRAAATAQITAQLVPPVGLEDQLDGDATAATLETAIRLTERVPVATLEFTPDAGFWTAVDASIRNEG
jgi:hypothetical protein